MRVRRYADADWPQYLRMILALFPEHGEDQLAPDMKTFLRRSDGAVFIAERKDGAAVGFVEVGTRPYADGCDTSPVGYVEAWYVDADARRQGVGRALLQAAEEFARSIGCREMASDAQIGNTTSYAAHRAAGYEEVDRVVQFRKALAPGPT